MKQHIHDLFRFQRNSDGQRSQQAALVGLRRAGSGPESVQRPGATFPVLAVLAPVVTQTEGEIAYPGDPMCLYAALSLAVERAVRANQGIESVPGYERLAPHWTAYPSLHYRLTVPFNGWRSPSDPVQEDNTDRSVFDPRVWDDHAREVFVRRLRDERPSLALISAVSPGHRYALEIAGIVKEELPGCLVVLGGRHADETIRFNDQTGTLELHPSSTLSVIADGRMPAVIDAMVTGQAYFAVDLLLRAAARAMDRGSRTVAPGELVRALQSLAPSATDLQGRSTILILDAADLHVFPIDAQSVRFEELPCSYRAFAIRSRFPIFPSPSGGIRLTAHAMLSSSCPYSCNFCSESSVVVGGLQSFAGKSPVAAAVNRICEMVQYGAEAVFFDDSVFWGGNVRTALAFCEALAEAREEAGRILGQAQGDARGYAERLHSLEWGAQFTADLIATQNPELMDKLLNAMKRAGCTYVYIGLESMSSDVMDNIHKNLRRIGGQSWKNKVRMACQKVKAIGMRVGSAVLFGLEGENRNSIRETIEEVGLLIDDGLLDLVSPNILTYHPATAISKMHGMSEQLDYHSPRVVNRPPYIYFEEAYPDVVSRHLSEDDIWYIHNESARRWGGTRNQMTEGEGLSA